MSRREQSAHNSLRRKEGEQARIYGHRGARGILPENTLESFEYLTDIGVSAVEFDIQLTSDDQVVLLHDPFVPQAHSRNSKGEWLDGPGPKVIETTLKELQSFDIGRFKPDSDYGARYPLQEPIDGARIPTLAAFFEWVKVHPNMLINIEIKSYADRTDLSSAPGILAQHTADLIEEYALPNALVVSSFDWRVLSALHKRNPKIQRAYLSYYDRENPPMQPNIVSGSPWIDGLSLASTDGNLPRLIAQEGGAAWCPYFKDLTPDTLAQAHAEGLAVNVWTVNEADDMKRMNAMGVDGIITDYPLRARDLLRASLPDSEV